jgi:hypothetical protein
MAYERGIWQFDNNRSYTPSSTLDLTKYQIWYLKAFLTGQIGGATQGLWTVVGSCGCTDGTVATLTGALDGVDRLGATFDPLKQVRGAVLGFSTPASWIVLRSPVMSTGLQFYLCISFTSSGSTQDYMANFRWSKTPFTIAATSTWPPTSPATAWGAASGIATSTQLNNPSFTTSPNRVTALLSPSGDFMVYWVRNNAGSPEAVVATLAPSGFRAGDAYPLWTLGAYAAGSANTGGPFYFPAAWVTTYGWAWDGSAATTNTASYVFGSTTGGGASDMIDGTIMDFPIWIIANNGTRQWMRGRLADIGQIPWNSGGTPCSPVGSVIRDISNNVIYATLGGVIIPASAVPDLT